MNVFFYGLFMDAALLAAKGIVPRSAASGHVDGFALRIGTRATLVRSAGTRVYGIMMDIAREQAGSLYRETSVADYVPEPVTVTLAGGRTVEAVCYNLLPGRVAGANRDYAESLLALAEASTFRIRISPRSGGWWRSHV